MQCIGRAGMNGAPTEQWSCHVGEFVAEVVLRRDRWEDPGVGGRCWDVTIVGAGVGGLSAAIGLAKRGASVLVIERRSCPGGSHRGQTIDGHAFPITPERLGAGLVRRLDGLGVRAPLVPTTTRLHVAGLSLRMPADLKTRARLLRFAPELIRLAKPADGPAEATLGGLIGSRSRSPRFADLAGVLAYSAGVPPDDLSMAAVSAGLSKTLDYGDGAPHRLSGPPDALARALAARASELGVTLRLETDCASVERPNSSSPFELRTSMRTSRGLVRSRAHLTTASRLDAWPEPHRPGMAQAHLLLVADSRLRLPRGVDAWVRLPTGVAGWMSELDRGRLPPHIGAHVQLVGAGSDGIRLMMGFFPPRDWQPASDDAWDALTKRLIAQAEADLPGLGRHIIWQRLVRPRHFEQQHGRRCRPTRHVLPPGFDKPPPRDDRTGIHHIGPLVAPEGQHTGARVLRALRAVNAIAAELGLSQGA